MKKPFNKRFAVFVKLGAGAVAAAAVIVSAVRGSALSRGAVVLESLPSESIVITSEKQTFAVLPPNNSDSEPPSAPSAVININTATAEELQTLPGIGKAKATAIVEYRERHGAFADISEITNVSGIGEAIFGQIRGKITTGAETSAPPNDPVSEPPSASSAAVNINTATAEELQTLPGIGKAKAAAIVEHRERYGAFTDVSEITNVSGIGEAIFGQICGKITTGTKTPAPPNNSDSEPPSAPSAVININTATAEELQTLPGIGKAKAAAIVEYREEHGAFTDVSEITNVSGIGEAIFGQIRGKITV